MSALSEFQQLIKELTADTADDALRRKAFLRDPCPLLECARLCRREGTLHKLAKYLRENDEWKEFRNRWADASLLDARCRVICAVADQPQDDQLDDDQHKMDLAEAIKAYARAWNYSPSEEMQDAWKAAYHHVAGKPAFIDDLPNGRTMDLFRSLASPNEFGPFHPGLHLVGATYAAICDDRERPRFKPDVTTWILLVATISGGFQSKDGYTGQLELQRVPGGCGALYPDPSCGAYLRTKKDFQRGLQHAWWAAIGRKLGPEIDFDVRWQLWVPDKNTEPLDCGLMGRSAEAGVAGALRALCENERLDEQVAITAQFEEPGGSNTRLMPVSEVAVKLLACEDVSELRKKGPVEVVVHRDQEANGRRIFADQGALEEESLPTTRIGEHVKVTGVTHLDEAYDCLSRWARLTRRVKAGVGEKAKKELDDECGKDGYLLSHFLRERSPKEMERGKNRWGDRLTEEQELELQLGKYPELDKHANRVKILGASGMGKTAFLMSCEQKIAAADDNRVPLHLKNLSSYKWDDLDALTSDLAAKFKDWVPEDEFRPWFDHLRRSGNLVILLDALDQTSKRWEELNKWLRETGGVDDCPVIMTGRFSVERGKKSVAAERIDWSVLKVEEFDEEQRKRYLGEELFQQLKMQPQDAKDTKVRKARWAKLMGTPLLLKLIRGIASAPGGLQRLANKYCIYHKALGGVDRVDGVDGLLNKGLKSARSAGLELGELADEGEPERRLGEIAWQMVRAGNIENIVTDQAYRTLRDEIDLGRDVDVLEQLNILNVQSTSSGQRCGLEWRHKSFCEYYAGVHLATALTRQEQTEHIENVMRLPLPEKGEIPACQDAVSEGADWAPGFADPEPWDPVFEFALSCAQQRGDTETLNGLANDLFRCGGIRVLRDFVAVESDPDPEKPQVADPLCELCLVLGGYSIDWRRDIEPLIVDRSGDDSTYEEAFKMYQEMVGAVPTQDVSLDATALKMLEQLFQERQYRRSEYLVGAWELLQERKENEPEVEACLERIHATLAKERAALQADLPVVEEFLSTFRPCPKRDGDKLEFTMGEEGDRFAPLRNATVRAFSLADFPVTNALFEAFDPSHVWDRDRWSRADDQPAVWVNWYQAQMFCAWLSAGGHDRFRLPTEAEWEYACRANAEPRTRYWWSDEFDAKRCNAKGGLGRTNGRREKDKGFDMEAHKNAWDLYDMLGNVWEWCQDEVGRTDPLWEPAGRYFGPVSFRVLRGGAFDDPPEGCRAADRVYNHPADRNNGTGIRVLLW